MRPTNTSRPSRPVRERVDFKFSNFQALQVPKGWDRLFVSLVSVETGKIIAKLGKAVVKNGSCQWMETLSESIHLFRDDSPQGYGECLVRLVVSMGSTRSSILGEATINMAQYFISPRASSTVSQSLKKCSYGTILQVKIQCLNPRPRIGGEGARYSNSQEKYPNVDHPDPISQLNGSDNSSESSVGSRSQEPATALRPLKLDSKETNPSESSLNGSFKSAEGSIVEENESTGNALKSDGYISHEKVGGSSDGSLTLDNIPVVSDSLSNQSLSSFRLSLREDLLNETTVNRLSTTNIGSSRNLLETAEDTIDELRAGAKMWERNARKLMFDLDLSRKECSDLSKKHADLILELSAAHAEQDGLKREIDKLKVELETLTMERDNREDPVVQSGSLVQIQRELENEIRYLQDLSDNLGQQLKQSQESNIELVSVLGELEETVEQQRAEIENLSSLKLDYYTDLENSLARNSEENRTLQLQLEKIQESEKKLQAGVHFLEEALKDKTNELENERRSNSQMVCEVEKEYKYKMSVMEEEIAKVETKLSEKDGNKENNVDLIREIESLRAKVQELEKDCTELTDENLELLLKLKDSNNNIIRKSASFNSMSSENPTDESEVCDPKFQASNLESSADFTEILKQLDTAFHLLEKPLRSMSCENGTQYVVSSLLELNKLLETKINECDTVTTDAKRKMEDKIFDVVELEKSKAELEEDYVDLMKVLDAKGSEFDDIKHELEEAKREKHELANALLGLQEENKHLQDFKSVAEDVQKQLLGAQEECEYLQNSNSELRRENQELHENCSALAAQLSSTKKNLSDCTKKAESLEQDLNSVLQGSSLKEHSFQSQVDALVQENDFEKEKLVLEIQHLSRQISDAYGERDRIASEGSKEISKLQEALQETELEVEDLTGQLDSCQQKHDTLLADHERILKLLASYKRNEEKLKSSINDLELKLTLSDYERQQLAKEIGSLKVQLQNTSGLEEQISILISELEGCRLEKDKLEISLHTVSGDYEKLKVDKVSFSDKISRFEDALSEFEECKKHKLAVEEKLMQRENEYNDLQNKLTELKRANVQLQQKMYRLENEKDECLKKTQALEENLKLMEETYKEGSWNVKKDQLLGDEVQNESRTSAAQRLDRTKSSLETELKDLRERYLEMSLKYAEVEAEREDLVMKLKTTKGGKSWLF